MLDSFSLRDVYIYCVRIYLVEVNSDSSLPILAEMVVRDLLVVLDRHFEVEFVVGVGRWLLSTVTSLK